MGVFAEFERAMIQERVKAGLARARTEGKRLGRPRLDSGLEKQITESLQQGMSYRKAAKTFKVSLGTVQRIVAS
jgi:DNA invertase Pin-like site-specific DNA recombinase